MQQLERACRAPCCACSGCCCCACCCGCAPSSAGRCCCCCGGGGCAVPGSAGNSASFWMENWLPLPPPLRCCALCRLLVRLLYAASPPLPSPSALPFASEPPPPCCCCRPPP